MHVKLSWRYPLHHPAIRRQLFEARDTLVKLVSILHKGVRSASAQIASSALFKLTPVHRNHFHPLLTPGPPLFSTAS